MSEPHERLDRAMNERRLDLRLQWTELAAAVNVKPESLRAIRRGDYGPSQLTARLLEDALGWERGSVRTILNGGAPTVLTKPERDPDVRGEDETALEWMDRQYELWKEHRDKREVLKSLFESWTKRDAS